jgi:hypothetical protein
MKSFLFPMLLTAGGLGVGLAVYLANRAERADPTNKSGVASTASTETRATRPPILRPVNDDSEVDDLFAGSRETRPPAVIAKYPPSSIDDDPPAPFLGSTQPMIDLMPPKQAVVDSGRTEVDPLTNPKPGAGEQPRWALERAVSAMAAPALAFEQVGLPREVKPSEPPRPWDWGGEIDQFLATLRTMSDRLPPPASTSLRVPTPVEKIVGSAKLLVSNEYSEEMSVVVNDVCYRLEPKQQREIKIPAGAYTFQVLQLQTEPQRREIAEGEERPLRIYTRR